MLALASQIPIAGQGGVELLVRELVRGLSAHQPIYLLAPDPVGVIDLLGLRSSIADYLEVDRRKHDEAAADLWAEWLKERKIDTLHFHFGGPYSWGAGELGGGLLPKLHRRGFRILVTNHQAVSPLSISKRDLGLPRLLAGHLKRLPGKLRQLSCTEKEYLVSRHDLALSRRWYPFQHAKFGQIYHSLLDGEIPAPPLPESRVILCLATICFRKGQHILMEAFARISDLHPEWKLRLVGMHTERECISQIREMVFRHGLESRVALPGPTNTPWQELATSEIYVQPSLLEGLGLSLQEAAFAQRPCIGSNTGGIPELISDGNSGLLLTPGDPAALASALGELIKSREKRIELGGCARLRMEETGMTRQEMISSYLKLY